MCLNTKNAIQKWKIESVFASFDSQIQREELSIWVSVFCI